MNRSSKNPVLIAINDQLKIMIAAAKDVEESIDFEEPSSVEWILNDKVIPDLKSASAYMQEIVDGEYDRLS